MALFGYAHHSLHSDRQESPDSLYGQEPPLETG